MLVIFINLEELLILKFIIMLKNILNLGNTLSKKEQKSIYGGEFCVWHCIDECYSSVGPGEGEPTRCIQNCIQLGGI